MSIQLFGNNIRIAQESTIAVRLNSDNIELWKHHNFCMCVTEVWSQGQVHVGHVLCFLLVPPPPSLLIIFELESPRLVLSSLCISGRAFIYDPTASDSTVAGKSSLCFTVTPPDSLEMSLRVKQEWRLWPVLPWSFSRVLAVVSPWSGRALGHAEKDCFLCSRCWLYAAPVVKLRHHQPEDTNFFLFIKSGALIFLSLARALELPFGDMLKHGSTAIPCPLAKMLLNILQRTRCRSLPKQTKNDSTPISALKG